MERETGLETAVFGMASLSSAIELFPLVPVFMAGASGVEPLSRVPKTLGLPLAYAPVAVREGFEPPELYARQFSKLLPLAARPSHLIIIWLGRQESNLQSCG